VLAVKGWGTSWSNAGVHWAWGLAGLPGFDSACPSGLGYCIPLAGADRMAVVDRGECSRSFRTELVLFISVVVNYWAIQFYITRLGIAFRSSSRFGRFVAANWNIMLRVEQLRKSHMVTDWRICLLVSLQAIQMLRIRGCSLRLILELYMAWLDRPYVLLLD